MDRREFLRWTLEGAIVGGAMAFAYNAGRKAVADFDTHYFVGTWVSIDPVTNEATWTYKHIRHENLRIPK
jgi:hypothetical protein